jgi:RAT1-interacting protein
LAFEETFTKSNIPNGFSTKEVCSIGKQWANVVSRTFGEMNLVFSGEVDSVENPNVYHDWFDRRVELKCKLSGSK